MAYDRGSVVVERSKCPVCGEVNFYGHCWNETIKCSSCGQSFASLIPRPPVIGDIRADQFEAVIKIMMDRLKGSDVPPLRDDEVAGMSDDLKRLLQRNFASCALATLEVVIREVRKLAELELEI